MKSGEKGREIGQLVAQTALTVPVRGKHMENLWYQYDPCGITFM